MPTGGSGSPYLRGWGADGAGKTTHPGGRAGGGGVWDQALWSSSHSFSAVGCQQAA